MAVVTSKPRRLRIKRELDEINTKTLIPSYKYRLQAQNRILKYWTTQYCNNETGEICFSNRYISTFYSLEEINKALERYTLFLSYNKNTYIDIQYTIVEKASTES